MNSSKPTGKLFSLNNLEPLKNGLKQFLNPSFLNISILVFLAEVCIIYVLKKSSIETNVFWFYLLSSLSIMGTVFLTGKLHNKRYSEAIDDYLWKPVMIAVMLFYTLAGFGPLLAVVLLLFIGFFPPISGLLIAFGYFFPLFPFVTIGFAYIIVKYTGKIKNTWLAFSIHAVWMLLILASVLIKKG